MATVKYLLQSKSETSNIYIRYSINRQTVFKRKTGFIINAKDWSLDKAQPKTGRDDLKILKSKLEKLSTFISDSHNNAISKRTSFTGEWLEAQINAFNNKVEFVQLDLLNNYIQKYIDQAPYKQNRKKELGLSKGHISNLEATKKSLLRFEQEILSGRSIVMKEINIAFIEKLKTWLFEQNYSVNYVGKVIANIKTVCFQASNNDIEISSQLKSVKTLAEKKAPEDIVFLSEAEQEIIKNTPVKGIPMQNAKKWLLLGCLVGQRGGDLFSITEKNIKEVNGMKIIELRQQKTGKLVAIPLLPKALEIVESGMPYPISIYRFNENIKAICRIAGLNTPMKGRKLLKGDRTTTKGLFPKYEIISSHVCRRSFASNFYSKIPTPILMNITAHAREEMFLSYIGKTTYENAYQMLEYFSKLAPTKEV
jgi:Phage integrase SAM-like domain